ncbi:MAG: phytanoyl-CoA dioxygenase family protein [Candidatus Puniceispirillaceae bacterium]
MLERDVIEAFQRDGAVKLSGVFRDQMGLIAQAIEANLACPGPYAAENLKDGEAGRFFDDYCNWQRLPAIKEAIFKSPMAEIAAALMQSHTAQLFHDHVLVKEPGTNKPTPWHQDSPYYFVEASQSVSFWIPVEPVQEATLRLVKGSHRWDKPVLPTRWLNEDDFYGDNSAYQPVPDPDAPDLDAAEQERLSVLEWPLEPGDAVAFDFRTLHGARGNHSDRRRRALSVRFVGDDAVYVSRPGRTSPPFPGHGMTEGQRLRKDWFPVLYPAAS